MPTRYSPDLSLLSSAEQEIARRVIKGSNRLYWEFVKARKRNLKDAERAQALVARVEREKDEFAWRKRRLYPSVSVRLGFMRSLYKSGLREFVDAIFNSHVISKVVTAFDYRSARDSYLRLIENPKNVLELFKTPIDLQKGQEPIIAAQGCVDSRVDLTTLLSAGLGQVLIRRDIACGIGDSDNQVRISPTRSLPVSLQAAQFLSMAVKKGVKHIVNIPHGKCGGIEEAADNIDQPEPEGIAAKLLWQLAQSKKEVFKHVQEKGVDYFLNRLDIHGQYKDDRDRFLQAVEICLTHMDLQTTRAFLPHVEGGKDVTASAIYLDLRTMDPHLVVETGSGEDDWRLLRLTQHTEIPCDPEQGHKIQCSCPPFRAKRPIQLACEAA